jgi:iron complex transport system substrate-binding protein
MPGTRNILMPSLFIICAIIFLGLAMFIQPGCAGSNGETNVRRVTLNPNDQQEQAAAIPSRVVSMSPNLTEIIYALGAGDLLVAVDDYSVYPPEAADKPKVGNYLDPNLEALAAIHPDLVLVVDNDEHMADVLSGLGLQYRTFANDSIREILQSIEDLGTLLGHPDEAQQIIDKFQNARSEVTGRLQGIATRSVALVVGRNPGRLQDIYVAGTGNYLSEMIEIAGGRNIFADQNVVWPQVGVEAFIGADPEVIIDSTLSKGATEEEFSALASDWEELGTIKAVQDGNIIVPEEGWFQIPGANLDRILMLVAHWIHPEIFPEVESPYAPSGASLNRSEAGSESSGN